MCAASGNACTVVISRQALTCRQCFNTTVLKDKALWRLLQVLSEGCHGKGSGSAV